MKKNKNRKRKSEASAADVDDALHTWFKAHRDKKNSYIGGPECLLKAAEFARKLGVEKFQANNGWLHRWKKRLLSNKPISLIILRNKVL